MVLVEGGTYETQNRLTGDCEFHHTLSQGWFGVCFLHFQVIGVLKFQHWSLYGVADDEGDGKMGEKFVSVR